MKEQFSRAAIDGVELQYRLLGSGEPIVLVHAGIFSDFFESLSHEPALIEHYLVVIYHRVGSLLTFSERPFLAESGPAISSNRTFANDLNPMLRGQP